MVKNQIKILAAMAVFLATLLVSIFAWRALEDIVALTLKKRLKTLSDHAGLQLSFDDLQLGLGVATLVGVSIGDDASIQIEKIRIEADFNLLDPQVLNPTEIKLVRPVFSLNTDQAERLLKTPQVAELLSRLISSPDQAEIRPDENGIVVLPQRVRIADGRFVLIDSSGKERFVMNGLHANLSRQPRKVTARVASLKIDHNEENNIEGRIHFSQKFGRYEFLVRRKKSAQALGWEFHGNATQNLRAAEISINAEGIPSLLNHYLDPVLANSAQTGLKGTAGIETLDWQTWKLSSDLRFDHVFVNHKSLGREAIGPIEFGLTSGITYHHPSRKIVITDGRLGFPAAKSTNPLSDGSSPTEPELPGNLSRDHEDSDASSDLVTVAFSAAGRLPTSPAESSTWLAKVRLAPTPCQSALRVLPEMLAPQLQGFKLEGMFGAKFDVRVNTNAAAAFTYKTFTPQFTCNVAEAPLTYRRGQLMGPFTLQRSGSLGVGTVEIPVNPNAPGFTALPQIGKNTINAIISAEDAGFYAHKGVEWGAMEQALRRNLTEQRIAIGGSTITMQTVKNLFLTSERTLGRKFQELFLAWHLDRELPKDRILEIYLNVAEFGPGIFGVNNAARHFFGKPTADLTLREATYLASVMPAPVKRFRYFCLGKTSENFDELINTLLRRMHGLGRINFDQYAAALNEPLIFNATSRLASTACNGVKQIAQNSSDPEKLPGALADKLGE